MKVRAASARLPHPSLPGADWVDRYEVIVPGVGLTAEEAARHLFGRMPAWAKQLLALRNIIVAPLGLKEASEEVVADSSPGSPRIGIFPVVSNAVNEIVLGFDDRHLDFRVVVDTFALKEGTTRVGVQTVIKVLRCALLPCESWSLEIGCFRRVGRFGSIQGVSTHTYIHR